MEIKRKLTDTHGISVTVSHFNFASLKVRVFHFLVDFSAFLKFAF